MFCRTWAGSVIPSFPRRGTAGPKVPAGGGAVAVRTAWQPEPGTRKMKKIGNVPIAIGILSRVCARRFCGMTEIQPTRRKGKVPVASCQVPGRTHEGFRSINGVATRWDLVIRIPGGGSIQLAVMRFNVLQDLGQVA